MDDLRGIGKLQMLEVPPMSMVLMTESMEVGFQEAGHPALCIVV